MRNDKETLRSVTDDCKLKVREISKMVNISTERVHNILHNHLDMLKLCTRQVPRHHQKLERAHVFQYNLGNAHEAVKTMTKLTELKYNCFPRIELKGNYAEK